MTEKTFPLERFYYGVLKGQTDGKPTVLAKTAGIAQDQMKECLQMARLAPPTTEQANDKMTASIGIFRGEKLDYILTVAQVNPAGIPQLLFVILPKEPMSWLAGNLQPFRSLGSLEMPVFASARDNLTPFILKDPKTATSTQLGKVMSNYLFYCQDNMQVAEGLLTSMIGGKNIAIINSPNSLEKRMNFVEGLASLLPPPVRLGVTFATNVLKADSSMAQIKFLVTNDPPNDHVVFDWTTGKMTPADYERHDYPKFILAQLRLDPERVIEHTENLSRTTAWRAMRKDSLADALGWAAQRARIDSTVMTGQPADRDKVANILRQDPTLSNELRVAYAKHLMAMTLALREWEPADILPGIAAAHRDVAEAIFAQMRDIINAKQQQAEVLDLVEHWMTNVAEAPALPWHQLWHLASWIELQKRLEGRDYLSAAEYIRELSAKKSVFKIDTVASQIILQTLKYAYESPELAQSLLILAASNVPTGGFQQLVTDERLSRQFPLPLQRAFAVIRDTAAFSEAKGRQSEFLMQGVGSLPSQHRPAVLAQLVEIALYLRKGELIDATILQEILRLAQSEHSERYRPLINYILQDFANFDRVKTLGPAGWRVLPQLYFMGGFVEEGVQLIELYQGNLFKTTQNLEYMNVVGDIFFKSSLSAEALNAALAGLENSRIWPDARIRAFVGALANQKWSVAMEPAARRLTTIIFNNTELTRSITPEEILRLLQFHGERSNALDMLRVASALVDKAVQMESQGPQLLVKAWPQLSWQPEVGQAALELMRRYIRHVPHDAAQPLPAYFSKELGRKVGDALEASYLVRTAIGEDNLHTFADKLSTCLALLVDIGTTYHPNKDRPTLGRLQHDLDMMGGNVTEDARQAMAQYIFEIGDMIYELGSQNLGNKKRPNTEWTRDKILEVLPETPVEFLLWLSAYFAKGLLTPLDLTRNTPSHLLGNRSIAMLYDEITSLHSLLTNLKLAYQEGVPKFSLEALQAEVASLWDSLSLYNQRQIEPIITNDVWQFAEFLRYMAGRTNDKFIKDKNAAKKLEAGKEQPQNELESLRWISGYFARKHRK